MADSSGVLSLEARTEFFEANTKAHASIMSSERSDMDRRVIREVLETTNEPTYQLMLFPTQLSIPEKPRSFSDYITPTEPENFITVMVFLNHPSHAARAISHLPMWKTSLFGTRSTILRRLIWSFLQEVFSS